MDERGSFIDAQGIPTHYHDAGDGSVVLLIHGSGPGVTAHANWRLVFPRLSQHFRVVAPDVLGFGYTEVPEDVSYDVDTWVSHVAAFLDALGIERCSIVGNSFGGALALHLAARYPERVDRLVLMGSAGSSFELTPGLDTAWGYEPSRENMRELLELFAYSDGLVDDALIDNRYQASLRPGVQEAYAAMFPAPRQRWIDALALDEKDLAEVQSQTLVVHGRDDKIIPVAASERLAEVLPKSQLRVFPQCGHWVQIEKADEFYELISNFLGEHEPADSVNV